MIKYLIEDLAGAMQYIPYTIFAWIGLLLVIHRLNCSRKKQRKKSLPTLPLVSFVTYLLLVLMITFWSRESGAITDMDLEIGASLRINNRNNALVLENVLLFIPFGYCLNWLLKRKSVFVNGFFCGFVTSFIIEVMQLVTGRGIFQIDDILTNTLGSILGAFVYRVVAKVNKRLRK